MNVLHMVTLPVDRWTAVVSKAVEQGRPALCLLLKKQAVSCHNTTAELCCPRQFDSFEWFVCARGEGGWTDGEDKPVEVNTTPYGDRKKGTRTVQHKKWYVA
jgi:hypothetical protein